jgi:hypothetical protein
VTVQQTVHSPPPQDSLPEVWTTPWMMMQVSTVSQVPPSEEHWMDDDERRLYG